MSYNLAEYLRQPLKIGSKSIDSSIKLIDGCSAVGFCYSAILAYREDIPRGYYQPPVTDAVTTYQLF
jgi:hypothetical protein